MKKTNALWFARVLLIIAVTVAGWPLAARLVRLVSAAYGQTHPICAWTNFTGLRGGYGNVDRTDTAGARPRLLSVESAPVRSNATEGRSWAVPYGQEFWRRPAAAVSPDPKRSGSTNLPATVNIGDVIERVRHALNPEPAGANSAVTAANYAASFGGQGLVFSPHQPGKLDAERSGDLQPAWGDAEAESRLEIGAPDLRPERRRHSDTEADENVRAPQPDPETQFACHTLALRQGSETLYEAGDQPPALSYEGNTAQARLNMQVGVVEHYELRSDGAHVTWVLARKPAGAGAATITLETSGLVYAGETGQGHHFADAQGVARVRFGPATAVDAAGRTWPLIVQADDGGSSALTPALSHRMGKGARGAGERAICLTIAIPAAVLAEAAYPLAIDPVIGPEFGMDNSIVGLPLGGRSSPSVAANGTDWLVVWQDERNRGIFAYGIYGARINSSGTVLDKDGIPICGGSDGAGSPSVAANGTDWLVVWADYRNDIPINPQGSYFNPDIYGVRVNSAGKVLDGDGIPISSATNYEVNPAVAANGTDWLVVWEDYQSGDGYGNIYGTRVNGSGTVLDSGGIAICSAPNTQEYPSVAADGTDWLVVWDDYRNDSGGWTNSDIYAARVNSDGTVLDTGGIAICTAADNQELPSVAANGTDWLVVWGESRSNFSRGIYGARVNSLGTVLDSGGITICTATNSQYSPCVAANGTDWLVVWVDYRNGSRNVNSDIYGARVSGSGTLLDSGGIAICTAPNGQYSPSVAANGTDWLVVWQDNPDDSGAYNSQDIHGARVNRGGAMLDSGGFILSTAANQQWEPAVAANGTDWLVVWHDYRIDSGEHTNSDIYAARVNSDGTVLDTGGIEICTAANNQCYPSVAANGTDWLVVWIGTRDYWWSSQIYGARVSGSGTVLDSGGITICTATADQSFPSVAANGTDWLVVWEDYRNDSGGWTNCDIYGARVNPNGTALDGAGIAICTVANHQYSPSVAANGTDWLVVWKDSRNDTGSWTNSDIYGARVNRNGTLLDGAGIAICAVADNQYSPSVAANGTDWLVAWEDYRSGDNCIYGARINRNGTLLDGAGIAICTATSSKYYPSVAANGTDWLVVWEEYRSGDNGDIYGARVNSSGTVVDTEGLAFTTGGGYQSSAAAELNGKLLIVYQGPSEAGRLRIRAKTFTEAACPKITSTALVDGTNLVFGGSGGSEGETYYVLASSNAAEWMTDWVFVATNTFGAGGTFSVTNAVDPAKPRQFFRLLRK